MGGWWLAAWLVVRPKVPPGAWGGKGEGALSDLPGLG